MNRSLLLNTYIFSGLSDCELDDALSYLNAREKSYKKGDSLIIQGDSITSFGIITSGTVQVSCDDINGNHMIMATVSVGDMFAESLAVTANNDSPIYAGATESCTVLWLDATPIRQNSVSTPLHIKIISNFMQAIAHKCLSMNDRIQILSKKTIREKVIAYISLLSAHGKSGEIILPLSRQDMASYLGVERSALSRELSNMQKEGIISYQRNSFRFLK